MKQEFMLLAAIIRDNTPEDYDYEPEVGTASAKRSDYDCCDVLPVSDPNVSTMAQRVIQYQAVMQLAQGAPQLYDLPFLHRQMIETLGIKNAQKIVPLNDDMKPIDPVSENMAIMNGKPVKAFLYQDHSAHIAVHMAAMQDPTISQIVAQNPKAQAIMAAGAAHIMEHLAYRYRAEVEQKLGVPLPPPPPSALAHTTEDEDEGVFLSPQEEVQISQLAALASQQLLQSKQAAAQQQQIQQQQQDPIIQMQQQELQLKQQQLQIDSQLKQAELQMKQQQFQMEMQLQKAEIDRKSKADIINATAKADDHKLKESDQKHRHQAEGTKLGVEIAKHKAEQSADGHRLGVDIAKHKAEKQHDRLKSGIDLMKHGMQLDHQADQNDKDREAQAAQQAQQPQQESSE